MKSLRQILLLSRGDETGLAALLDERGSRWVITCLVVIILGCGVYGGVVGLWRGPQQALYTAIKMPLLIFLTCGANALLNGLLAQVLRTGLGFRQSALAILMSFTLAALILAALSPVALFILVNAPALASEGQRLGHSVVLLTDVLFVAYAGIMANRRLLRLLIHTCATAVAARQVFWSWLVGNLFLGAQLAWVLRPFIGSPGLAVEFLRPDPLHGTFYSAVFRALRNLFLHFL